MAVGLDLSNLACMRHPQKQAAARCVVCLKPVCSSCIVQHNGQYYCSAKCKDTVAVAEVKIDEVAEAKKRQQKKRLVLISAIGMVVVVVGVTGALLYSKHQHKVHAHLEQLQKDAEATAHEFETEVGRLQ